MYCLLGVYSFVDGKGRGGERERVRFDSGNGLNITFYMYMLYNYVSYIYTLQHISHIRLVRCDSGFCCLLTLYTLTFFIVFSSVP